MRKLLNLNNLKIEYFGSDRWKDMGNIVDMLFTRDLVDAEDGDHGAELKLGDQEVQRFVAIEDHQAGYRDGDHHKCEDYSDWGETRVRH